MVLKYLPILVSSLFIAFSAMAQTESSSQVSAQTLSVEADQAADDNVVSEQTGSDNASKDKEESSEKTKYLMLQSYEPNTVGYRSDSNDVDYMDFKISLKYPLFHNGIYQDKNHMGLGFPFFYFTFTGQWAQYLGTRDSSPVIAKRYNPTLFGRYWLGSNHDSIDLIFFGHESNGQSIDTLQVLNIQRLEIASTGDDPEFARDYLSRGWDYVGLDWKNGHLFGRESWTSYLKLKYFLETGVLQKDIEDYNPWEDYGRECDGSDESNWIEECKRVNDENTRDNFDGITFIVKNDLHYEYSWLEGNKIAFVYTTGYGEPFKNSTYRLEFTTTFVNVPIMIWGQTGYNSDLIDYYEKVDSFGIALELRNFL